MPVEEPRHVARRGRQPLAVGASSVGVLDRPERRPTDDRLERVRLERELRDDAEVATAAADRPEEVRVLVGARGHLRAVGEHHLRREQVVDREPVPPRRGPCPPPSVSPATPVLEMIPVGTARLWPGRRVDLSPHAAAADPHRAVPGSTEDRLHRREVDHDAVVGAGEAAPVVAAASNRERQVVPRAKRITAATSAAVSHRAISAGRLWTIALKRARASSYRSSRGPIRRSPNEPARRVRPREPRGRAHAIPPSRRVVIEGRASSRACRGQPDRLRRRADRCAMIRTDHGSRSTSRGRSAFLRRTRSPAARASWRSYALLPRAVGEGRRAALSRVSPARAEPARPGNSRRARRRRCDGAVRGLRRRRRLAVRALRDGADRARPQRGRRCVGHRRAGPLAGRPRAARARARSTAGQAGPCVVVRRGRRPAPTAPR